MADTAMRVLGNKYVAALASIHQYLIYFKPILPQMNKSIHMDPNLQQPPPPQIYTHVDLYVVFACMCVRACVRACVCVSACVYLFVCVNLW